MDFTLSQDQKMLAETAASFAKKTSPVTRFRALREDARGWDPATWKKMAELGWLGILFPESAGGFGSPFFDAALVLEQLGTTLVPEPYLDAVIFAGTTIRDAGNAEQHKRWLAPLIEGDVSLAFGWAERGSRFDPTRIETRATKDGGAFTLRGEKVWVGNGHAADHLIVSARTSGSPGDAGGVTLFVLDKAAKGLTVQPVKTLDGHRAAMLKLDGVRVETDRVLGQVDAGAPIVARALDIGAAGACAEGLGLVQAMLEQTVAYLNTREQFGVKIGTFQALQHRAVDMFVEVQLCRSTSVLAAVAADNPDAAERAEAISAAKAQLAWGGRYVSQQAIQLHGGIGITDEVDIGLYFKRMHALNTLFGDEEHHVARFASAPSFAAGL